MIIIKDLNYYVNHTPILVNINLELARGEFASIIGPNGAGKSTLIKIILGLIPGFRGEILINGEKQKTWLRRNIIGYMPQKEQFDRNFPATATDIVLMGIAGKKGLFTYFNKADKAAAHQIMESTGVYRHKDNYIGSLSGGELQRVLLARALISKPEYLFLDEPDANVDKDGVAHFYALLNELHAGGKTILMVSHDIHNTSRFCSQLICLNKTLHCHTKPELLNAEIMQKTFGDVLQIIERK